MAPQTTRSWCAVESVVGVLLMGGISASGHGYYAHGNTAGLDGWWWCVWGFVVAHCWVVDQQVTLVGFLGH